MAASESTGTAGKPLDAQRAREVVALMTLLLAGAVVAHGSDLVLDHQYWPPNRTPLSAAQRAARFLDNGASNPGLPLELVTFRCAYCDQLDHKHGAQGVVTCVHIVLALTELMAAGYSFQPDHAMAASGPLNSHTLPAGVTA